MELEGNDIHVDKEPDGVIIYSNGVTHDSSYANASQLVAQHMELVNLDSQPADVLDENVEVRDHDIKECNNEKSVEITKLCQVETYMQTLPSFNSEINMFKEDEASEGQKVTSDNKKAETCGIKASRYAVGSCKTKYTVPQPFALATEKRASYGNLPFGAEFDNTSGNKPSHVRIMQHPTSAKQNTTVSSIVQRKPLQPDNKKCPDEDNCLVASQVMTSTRKFRTTVTSAPVFKSSERAERRKEFYSKLEEKHQALETQKTQCEQRTKEETEAAIRQLRKSLLFKASPMPSFYNDGPPPMVELKKPPPTRAISPKLGRKKNDRDSKSLDKETQEARRGFPACRHTPITSAHRKFGINIQNHTPSC